MYIYIYIYFVDKLLEKTIILHERGINCKKKKKREDKALNR